MVWDDMGMTREEYYALKPEERWKRVKDFYLNKPLKKPAPPRPQPPKPSGSS